MAVRVLVEVSGELEEFDFPEADTFHIDDTFGRLHIIRSTPRKATIASFNANRWVAASLYDSN